MAAYYGYLEQRKENRISNLQDARIIAYYAVAEHLDKGTRITDLFPIPGDDMPGESSPKFDPISQEELEAFNAKSDAIWSINK